MQPRLRYPGQERWGLSYIGDRDRWGWSDCRCSDTRKGSAPSGMRACHQEDVEQRCTWGWEAYGVVVTTTTRGNVIVLTRLVVGTGPRGVGEVLLVTHISRPVASAKLKRCCSIRTLADRREPFDDAKRCILATKYRGFQRGRNIQKNLLSQQKKSTGRTWMTSSVLNCISRTA